MRAGQKGADTETLTIWWDAAHNVIEEKSGKVPVRQCKKAEERKAERKTGACRKDRQQSRDADPVDEKGRDPGAAQGNIREPFP